MDFIIIAKYWLFFYYYLYIYCLPLLLFIFWFWLTHVDRVHLRLKFNKFGKKTEEYLKMKFHDNSETIKIFNNYVMIQINSFGEILAGFTDGFLKKTSSVKIDYRISTHTQTNFEKEISLYNSYSQTDEIKKNDIFTNTEGKNDVKKLFVSNKKKILDTEILEKDIEEDLNAKFNTKKEKRIFLVKK
jgi:hypothetical protein